VRQWTTQHARPGGCGRCSNHPRRDVLRSRGPPRVRGCDALALRAGLDLPREQLQTLRGWTDQDWDAAAHRLAERGWLRPDGRVTPEGAAAHQALEDTTDRAAPRPWARLGRAGTEELASLLAPVALACAAELPYPNPVGVPEPAVAAAPD
jgi:hypothetical protein